MAIVPLQQGVTPHPWTASKDLPTPPPVVTTPCDPWPRPYYLENGLRRVAPYHFTYNTYCKQRWRGREILDIFAAEFRDRSKEYYQEAIESGQITVNGKACTDVHQVINNGDVISHTLHRHEPPVTAQPIRVLAESDDMIVIDKPAGVPVHPAGRYRYNSIVEIMRAERNHGFNPLPVNRLDRLTSGVMFVGKTSREAEKLSEKLRGRTVRKEYVARVKGRFPDGEGYDGKTTRGGVVVCDESILQISPILGLNRARASGKSAKTLFRRIAYYPKSTGAVPLSQSSSTQPQVSRPSPTSSPLQPSPSVPSLPSADDEGYSIVHCLPLTGRTHQIRVHLQFLGHPITNDPIYSNRRVFGSSLARNDASAEHDAVIIEKLRNMGKTELADALDYGQVEQTQQVAVPKNGAQRLPVDYKYKPLNAGTLHAGSISADEHNEGETPTAIESTNPDASARYASLISQHDEMVSDYNRRKGEKMTGELCAICQTPLYSDPGPQELGIYLHALAYSDANEGGWEYRTPLPSWASRPGTGAGDEDRDAHTVHGQEDRGERPEERDNEKQEVILRWEYDGSEVLPEGFVEEEERVRKNRNRDGGAKNKQ